MKAKVNNNVVELAEGTTVGDIAVKENLPAAGVAIAINNDIVPRDMWADYAVSEGDDIIIVKAFCGG